MTTPKFVFVTTFSEILPPEPPDEDPPEKKEAAGTFEK